MCAYVCVKWADKGCEGRYVAFSFGGQANVHSPWQVPASFAGSMIDGCKMNVNSVN